MIRFALAVVLLTACQGGADAGDAGPPPFSHKGGKVESLPAIACEELEWEMVEDGIARVRFDFVAVPSLGNGCDALSLITDLATFEDMVWKRAALDPRCRACTYRRIDTVYASELELVVRVRRASDGLLSAMADRHLVVRTARYQTLDAYVEVEVGGRRQLERLVCKGSLCFLDPSREGIRPAEWGDVDY